MSNKRPVGTGIEHEAHLMAFLDAMDAVYGEKDISTVLVQHPDFAPPGALYYLAEQNDMTGYKGFSLCTNDDQRRNLLKNAPAINRVLGTPFSIEQAIESVGYPKALVTEFGLGMYYDGQYAYDGSKLYGGGKWYYIGVQVWYNGHEPTDDQKLLVRNMINKFKSTRSVLFNLKFTPFNAK